MIHFLSFFEYIRRHDIASKTGLNLLGSTLLRRGCKSAHPSVDKKLTK